jgi:hypothetical protein
MTRQGWSAVLPDKASRWEQRFEPAPVTAATDDWIDFQLSDRGPHQGPKMPKTERN